MRVWLSVPLAALLFVACGGDDDELKPASEAFSATAQRDASVRAEAKVLDAGQGADFPNGLRVIVQGTKDIERPGRTEPLRWVEIALRMENTSDKAIARAEVSVTCSGGAEGRFYLYDEAGDRDLSKLGEVPPKTFAEAVALIGVPKPCDDARIKVSAPGVYVGSLPEPAYWRLP